MLTKEYFFTFKDAVSYVNPTEVFEMQQCTTVKTADDESYKQYSFVSARLPHPAETGKWRVDLLPACGDGGREGGLDWGPRKIDDQAQRQNGR